MDFLNGTFEYILFISNWGRISANTLLATKLNNYILIRDLSPIKMQRIIQLLLHTFLLNYFLDSLIFLDFHLKKYSVQAWLPNGIYYSSTANSCWNAG